MVDPMGAGASSLLSTMQSNPNLAAIFQSFGANPGTLGANPIFAGRGRMPGKKPGGGLPGGGILPPRLQRQVDNGRLTPDQAQKRFQRFQNGELPGQQMKPAVQPGAEPGAAAEPGGGIASISFPGGMSDNIRNIFQTLGGGPAVKPGGPSQTLQSFAKPFVMPQQMDDDMSVDSTQGTPPQFAQKPLRLGPAVQPPGAGGDAMTLHSMPAPPVNAKPLRPGAEPAMKPGFGQQPIEMVDTFSKPMKPAAQVLTSPGGKPNQGQMDVDAAKLKVGAKKLAKKLRPAAGAGAAGGAAPVSAVAQSPILRKMAAAMEAGPEEY